MTDKLNICFVAHNAYGAIKGGHQGHVGGVERQVSLMAKLLAEKGHTISLITWNDGGDKYELIHGVNVIKICGRNDGIPILRFIHPRWTSLTNALSRANADIYYQNGAEYVTGQVAFWCKHHNKSFVFSSASDMDTDISLPELNRRHERFLYRYGLKNAQMVISQTQRQYRDLLENFAQTSIIMPMPCPGPDDEQYTAPTWQAEDFRVLWAGRFHPIKRLELLLDAAESLKNVTFHITGDANIDNDYCKTLTARLHSIDNVVHHGMVPREKMQEFYQLANLFCCTSSVEGFPNTFLEAWSHGLPIVTTFDPDNIIATREIGASVKSIDGLVEQIERLHVSKKLWEEMSSRARQYYKQNHEDAVVIDKFENLFQELNEKL